MQNSLDPLAHPVVLTQPRRLTAFSAWHEHIPAAMLLIDLLKPRQFVELGTHYGDSYCAFCQAVEELGLRTRCYAVDSWQGDAQTGFYGPEVLADLRAHHDPLYSSFSTLVQSTFDEALVHFADGTIDLLHIDGSHTYDAVKHDYDCWFGKLSTGGVVLFHDINVREGDFGVWRLWEELAALYPHFEFAHGHGLGVLAIGQDQPRPFQNLLASSEEELIQIGKLFSQLGYKLELQARLAAQEAKVGETRENLLSQIAKNEQQVLTLSAQLAERDGIIQGLGSQKEAKERTIQELGSQLEEKDRTIQDVTVQLLEKEQEEQTALTKLGAREQTVQGLDSQLVARERTIEALNQTLEEQTAHVDALAGRVEFLTGRVSELRELLLEAHSQLVERDNEIQRLRHEGVPSFAGVEATSKRIQYLELIDRIRQVVNKAVPPHATVIVVSKGDEELLHLNRRKGWHFPQTVRGIYAGHYPADSAEAISHLESLRDQGADYLLFPQTAFWWLDYYADLKRHLEGSYRRVVNDKNVCIIYSLKERIGKRSPVRAYKSKSRKAKPKR